MSVHDDLHRLSDYCFESFKNRKNINAKIFLAATIQNKGQSLTLCNLTSMEKNPCGHAEARVISSFRHAKDAILFVARVGRAGAWRMSKPCPRCQKLIKRVGIRKVYYTIDENEYGVYFP